MTWARLGSSVRQHRLTMHQSAGCYGTVFAPQNAEDATGLQMRQCVICWHRTHLHGSCHRASPASAAATSKMRRLRGMWKSLVTTASRLRALAEMVLTKGAG